MQDLGFRVKNLWGLVILCFVAFGGSLDRFQVQGCRICARYKTDYPQP